MARLDRLVDGEGGGAAGGGARAGVRAIRCSRRWRAWTRRRCARGSRASSRRRSCSRAASRPRRRTPSSTRWCRRRRTSRCSSARASSSTGASSTCCEERFPERVAAEPEVVARHCEAAGRSRRRDRVLPAGGRAGAGALGARGGDRPSAAGDRAPRDAAGGCASAMLRELEPPAGARGARSPPRAAMRTRRPRRPTSGRATLARSGRRRGAARRGAHGARDRATARSR